MWLYEYEAYVFALFLFIPICIVCVWALGRAVCTLSVLHMLCFKDKHDIMPLGCSDRLGQISLYSTAHPSGP